MQRMMYALFAAAVGTASFALAQSPATQPTADAGVPSAGGQKEDSGHATYSLSAGTAYQFQTNVGDSGKFSLERTGVGASLHYPIPGSRFTLDHSLVYERDDYHFADTPLGIDPWTNTNLVSYSLHVGYGINRDWSVFAGPVLGFNAEDGADWSRAFSYGATAGTHWRVSRDFSLGLGVIAIEDLDNDFTLFPLVLVNWQITPDLYLGNARPQPGIRGGAGIELAWTFVPKWELAGGFAYDKRRFRLNDDTHAMVDNNVSVVDSSGGGVGQNISYPAYVRLSFRPDSNWSFTALGGMILGGRLHLEDSNGNDLADQNYDPAPFVGAAVSWRR